MTAGAVHTDGTQPADEGNPLVGVWTLDEGYQMTELLLRSDGRYQTTTKSLDPDLDYSLTEPGRYAADGSTLTLTPYEYIGEPEHKLFQFDISGETLTLVRSEYELTYVYQLKPGSTADVINREHVEADLVGTWTRDIPYSGTEAYTFRPDGRFIQVHTPQDSQFAPDIVRGRYSRAGSSVTITPYSGVDAAYELDFFGDTLTLITMGEYSVQWYAYSSVPGSAADVRARVAEAQAFLSREYWYVGMWEVRDDVHRVDLTLRPDGYYIAHELTESLPGVVRGRYTLDPTRIQLTPFVGQDIYARSNGEFGKVERIRELDFFDGELQFIDPEALSQSVTLARKRPDSEADVLSNVQQAQTQRAREGWYLGIWEVNDPSGWMQFTLRPDQRYIAQAGPSAGAPSEVERGRFCLVDGKLTLAPYAGLGEARAFETDLYADDLFMVGDPNRLVVARKLDGSEAEVADKTQTPIAMQGERGPILGRWSADLPGASAELVLRTDGQFRLNRCADGVLSQDYGLYSADSAARTLVSDSRFRPVQTLGLDYYGETLTLYGGTLGPPSTYVVNRGTVDAAIQASLAADAEEARTDAAWLARVPIGAADPNVVQTSTADIPADPQPQHVFADATVCTQFAFYRRLLPGFVYFNVMGSIRTVPVVNTREFYFFSNGRLLVRFRNYHATPSYPMTTVEVSDNWGAYRIVDPSPKQDILHIYADNGVMVETDLGEQIEMTLEDGRRSLFWGKDSQLLGEWASEQQPVACTLPQHVDASLMNTGISLRSSIAPDEIPEESPPPAPHDPSSPPPTTDEPTPQPPTTDEPTPGPPTDQPSTQPPTDEPTPKPPTDEPTPNPEPVLTQVTIALVDTPLGERRTAVAGLLSATAAALSRGEPPTRISLQLTLTAPHANLAALQTQAEAAGASWLESPSP